MEEFAFRPPLPVWGTGRCWWPAILARRAEAASQRAARGAAPETDCSCCPRHMTSCLLMSSGGASLGVREVWSGTMEGGGKKRDWQIKKQEGFFFQHEHLFFSPPPSHLRRWKAPGSTSFTDGVCVSECARLCWLPANIPPKTTASLLSPALAGVEPRRFRLPIPKASSCASEPAPVKSAKVSKVSGRGAFLSEVSRQ